MVAPNTKPSHRSPDAKGSAPSGNKGNAQKSPNAGGGKAKKTKESTKRQSMLNTHKERPFKYDMNEILAETSMDPAKASAFLATVIAKAKNISTKEAKEFIKTFIDSGDLTKEESDRICRLLDKYSKFR